MKSSCDTVTLWNVLAWPFGAVERIEAHLSPVGVFAAAHDDGDINIAIFTWRGSVQQSIGGSVVCREPSDISSVAQSLQILS